MKNILFFFWTLSIMVLGFSCGNSNSGGTTISGTINNAGNLQVYLDKIGINPASANLVVGKADADASGNFKLDFPEKLTEGLYRLRVGEQKMNLVLDGKESAIQVKGDLPLLNQFQYEVTGSASSSAYRNLMQRVIARQLQITDIKNYVDTTANSLAGMLVAVQTLGGNPGAMEIYNKAKERLEQQFPGSTYVKDYGDYLVAMQQAAMNPAGDGGYQFIDEANRQPAPDIRLPNPAGKEYALSDLKGKVVLLDFWASWCRPCRMENPNVVKIYNQYKDKGFTVFSVSLDGIDSRSEARFQNDAGMIKQARVEEVKKWKKAISDDGLLWDYHVSDLKKWECAPAQVYGVSSIPRTFMIDKEGRVAAVNIRGAEMIEQTLQKLL
jgi:peroxiredoxin